MNNYEVKIEKYFCGDFTDIIEANNKEEAKEKAIKMHRGDDNLNLDFIKIKKIQKRKKK